MKSTGKLLKETREQKGYSIEQVARATNISKNYIVGLENDDSSAFPGETYLIGFLRNYSEFLDLPPDKVISNLRNLRMQEQPPPMEQLIKPPAKIKLVAIIIPIVAVALLATGWLLFRNKAVHPPNPVKEEVAGAVSAVETRAQQMSTGGSYEFQREIMERSFYPGDEIVVFIDSSTYPIVVAEIGPPIVLSYDGRLENYEVGSTNVIDLTGDGRGDVKLVVRQLLEDEGEVVLHLDRALEGSPPIIREPDVPVALVDLAENIEHPLPEPGSTSLPNRTREELLLSSDSLQEPFTLEINLKEGCLIRYQTDRGVREERYFSRGEILQIEASRALMIWVSNAGALTAKVRGVEVPMGGPGAVAAYTVQWVTADDGASQLKAIPAY